MMTTNTTYDAIIIGFGKGGKTLAATLGNAGKRTLLIEQSPKMYGGTCINVGCIPTKFLVHKAREAKFATTFPQQQDYYRHAIREMTALTGMLREKNLNKVANTPNVTVLTGKAMLRSSTHVDVQTADGIQRFTGEKIFINTGAAPVLPPIQGLAESVRCVVSETLLQQESLPKHLVIIGGGYIGIEFASLYADFGSRVTILQNEARFLPREDAEIATAVYNHLKARGVEILTEVQITSVQDRKEDTTVTFLREGVSCDVVADTVLVATGRRPNTEGLGLDNAGVEVNARGGIITNEHLQTTAPNIYAMGDVVGGLQFTYISLDDFRIVRSAILGDGSRTTLTRGAVPYSVFLNPPFSRVGMHEEALAQGYTIKVKRLPAQAIPKALVVQQPAGLLKVIIDDKTDLILGAHLFCEESHELINLIKVVMDAKLPYTVLRDSIFTHPTMSEALNDLFA